MRTTVGPRILRTRIALASVLATAAIVAGAGPANAATIREMNGHPADASSVSRTLPFGVWRSFIFDEEGSTTRVFRFESDQPVRLRVTDAFCRGDEFAVLDRGSRIFRTSDIAVDPSCDDVPRRKNGRPSWLDPSYSKGAFLLQPGSHRVKIRVTQSPFEGGGAYLRIDEKPVQQEGAG